MTNNFKNVYKNVSRSALVVGLFLLCGCSSDENGGGCSRQSMNFAPSIEDMSEVTTQTRTTTSAANIFMFDHGDQVGIYAWTGSKDITPPTENRVVNNGKITFDRNTYVWSAEAPMLWKNPVEKHYFMGFYPYPSEPIEDFTNVPFEIKDVYDLVGSDPLVALRTDGLTSTSNPIDMQFKHLSCMINVDLSYRDQFGGIPNVDKVVLGNVTMKGSINCLTQSITPVGDRSDFQLPVNFANTGYRSIMLPQDGIKTITITIDGKDYVYTHPTDIPFESGKMTKMYLTVGQDGIRLGGMNIDQWGEAGSYYGNTNGYNQAQYITDQTKLNMIYSLTDLEGYKGRIYEMDYTEDYKLGDALNVETKDINGLMGFVYSKLYDKIPSNVAKQLSFGAGCSAFAADDKNTGNHLMGRNYDFYHKNEAGDGEEEIAAIVVHTAPQGGKKSVSVVDGNWLGLNKGFYTDAKTDLSMLMAVPYAFMDGVNEDGFAIGVLHLGGNPAQQKESGKPNIFMNVAMRMLLDKAADVDEAVELLNQYNMQMTSPAGGSYHFYMADAKGKYAIVEYVNENGDVTKNPCKIEVLTGNDLYRYVTNFYVSESMANTDFGNKSTRGKERYEKMQKRLWGSDFKLTTEEARNLLEDVSQGPDIKEQTSHTQWSSLYDLNEKNLTLWLLREYYGKKPFVFKVK